MHRIGVPAASCPTLAAAGRFRRRGLLQAAAALPLTALVRPARAASTLNLHAWTDYVTPRMIEAFRDATGIQINLSVFDSNGTLVAGMRATGGEGFDLVMPTINQTPRLLERDLIQPLDEARLNLPACAPDLLAAGDANGGVLDGVRYAVPYVWGTEGFAWVDGVARLERSVSTMNDLLALPQHEDKVTLRPTASITAIGWWMESVGTLPPGTMTQVFVDEAVARATFDTILAWGMERRGAVRQWWKTTQDSTAAFLQNGCVAGYIFDGAGFRLVRETEGKIRFGLPQPSGGGYIDALSLSAAAEHVDEAYRFIEWFWSPSVGALAMNETGYRTAAAGIEAHLDPLTRQIWAESYEDGAGFARVHYSPAKRGAFYSDLRDEYGQRWRDG